MENTSSFRPIAVKVACLKEPITFFKKEVVGDELVFLSIANRAKRVKVSSKLSRKVTTGLNDLLLDSISLFSSDLGAKREFSQVTSDSDAGGYDHCCVFRRERRALEFSMIHIALVTTFQAILVVVFNNFVKERSKSLVGVSTSSIYSYFRVWVFATRKDSLFEAKAAAVLYIFELIPN